LVLNDFQLIIVVSLLARWSALLWLIPVQDVRSRKLNQMVESLKRLKRH